MPASIKLTAIVRVKIIQHNGPTNLKIHEVAIDVSLLIGILPPLKEIALFLK
jgi:phosphate starvation-inducible membrane PsiE